MATRARRRTAFFCTECGHETPRWEGQCPGCGAWNSLVEELAASRVGTSGAVKRGARGAGEAPRRLGEVSAAAERRWSTGLEEFDFVLGGGVVPGSLVLIGGEPGIGKSTILLQVAARLASAGRRVLYVSGEESAQQVRMRADRLGDDADAVSLLTEIDLEAMLERAEAAGPHVLLVDSIQTVHADALDGAPGGVGQVRECAARLQRFAKRTNTAVFLVGHVTKGGGIAGPKTLEHIVDTVLYFEDSGGLEHRVLRATKNRFGGVDEIGVFRMTGAGLVPVENPSELFVRPRSEGVAGSAVVARMEGTRPLLVEVQALATRASYGAPQRVSTGLDHKRLSMLLAVLEKRAGFAFGQLDVFLNVVGGLRLRETAGDLAVAVALLSSVLDRPVPAGALFLGELGLGGEIRAVGRAERRIAEAARMGLRTVYLAAGSAPAAVPDGVRILEVENIRAVADLVFPGR